MTRNKPFSRTEMKILVYNKVKRGLTHDQACKELNQEIKDIIENSKKAKAVEKEVSEVADNDNFKDAFKELTK